MMKKCVSLLLTLVMVCSLGGIASATTYEIYEGQPTVDGDLSDWSGATWINLTEDYYSEGTGASDLSNPKFAVVWSAETNLIYIAVTGVDTEHTFIAAEDATGVWNACDGVDVFVDAGNSDLNGYCYAYNATTPYWMVAQQYCSGFKADGTLWSALAGQPDYDGKTTESIASGILEAFEASIDGDTLNYEFAIKPYRYFNIDDPSTSTVVKLFSGRIIGLDVVMGSKNAGGFGMLSENLLPTKYQDAGAFQTYTLVGAPMDTTIEFVEIGDPGNDPDVVPMYGYEKRPFGQVDYTFYMGKFEITTDQYCEFLNAAAASNARNLYDSYMVGIMEGWPQQINQAGSEGSYTYTVNPGFQNRPVTYINWDNAARYCNWLTTGDTENGVYTFMPDGTFYWQNVSAYINEELKTGEAPAYWIPDSDEYYKAAYYDAATDSYFWYATGSNDTPTAGDYFSNNSGNWREGGVMVIGDPYYLTEVGSFASTASPYGCQDMLGNVWEWSESFAWGPWVDGVHTYGPMRHGGGYWSSTHLYCCTDYFSGYVAPSTTDTRTSEFGMRIACNPAAMVPVVEDIPGDANHDGMVDVGDLGILAANYGTTTGATWEQGDFNDDDAVDVGDLGILAANYGTGTSGADFDADYAKVFGEEEAEETDAGTLCSGLGLPLIAGLLLMGLMLVKLED